MLLIQLQFLDFPVPAFVIYDGANKQGREMKKHSYFTPYFHQDPASAGVHILVPCGRGDRWVGGVGLGLGFGRSDCSPEDHHPSIARRVI